MKFSSSTMKAVNAEKEIDTADLTWSELALLRKEDAFMYYSIPGVRDEELPGKDIDLSGLGLPTNSVTRSFTVGIPLREPDQRSKAKNRLCSSFTKKEAEPKEDRRKSLEPQESKIVKRRSTISVESCMNIDRVLDEIDNVQAERRAPRRISSEDAQRGSFLLDILFSSLDLLGREEGGDEDKSETLIKMF